MDSRTAAHVLSQISAYLELAGDNPFKARAYKQAARGILSTGADDLGDLLRSGALEEVPGVGPATLAVIRDLVATGESRLLEQLREQVPEGLLELLKVPGLGTAKIHKLHEELGIESVDDLEAAARDGRVAKLPRYGPKTAEKILRGIAFMKASGVLVLYRHAIVQAEALLAEVRAHPDVARAEITGSIRRRLEVVGDVDIVAACTAPAEKVAASFARVSGVREASGVGGPAVRLGYVDGTTLDLTCVPPERFAAALWRTTGAADHVLRVRERLATRGLSVHDDALHDEAGGIVPVPDEAALYAAAGLAYVEPELREGHGEVEAAAGGGLPRLVDVGDVRGVLHCHSDYSDGKESIAALAAAARERGWDYLGISDHSESAFYAGGLTRERVLEQHDEIDEVNASLKGFRVLKGIECDIRPDGRLDYDESLLDRFDYVIGSVHSRFSMGEREMTERVLSALDDPHLTILGHPTGRLLLSREAYAVDLDAVLARAAEVGAAVELNCDPYRMDLDWRWLRQATALGASVEIGPDAHSSLGLDNVARFGIGAARKGWLEAKDILNARSARDVVAFARRRRRH